MAEASAPHPLWTYSQEIMSFSLGAQAPGDEPPPAAPGLRDKVLRAASRPGVRDVVLLGLGSGELAAALAELGELAELAGTGKRIVVAELDPARARRLASAGRLPWLGPDSPVQLAADASATALAFLIRLAAGFASPLTLTNPELDEAAKRRYAPLRALLAGQARRAAAPDGTGRPRLCFGAIVHPGEPDLADFFGHAAGLAEDMALVWDGADLPPQAGLREIPASAVQLARPLGDDFAAQRNAMLAACPGGAVLSLDADERASPGLVAALPALAGFDGYAGVYLPRLTLGQDGLRVLCGYGLWPDLQLRLFRKSPGARYARPVHERVEDLSGPSVIAPAAPLVHLSHVMKSATDLRAKLARFDAASGGQVGHRLAGDYPSLPRAFFEGLLARTPATTIWPAD